MAQELDALAGQIHVIERLNAVYSDLLNNSEMTASASVGPSQMISTDNVMQTATGEM